MIGSFFAFLGIFRMVLQLAAMALGLALQILGLAFRLLRLGVRTLFGSSRQCAAAAPFQGYARVIDGDTLDIEGLRIRLFGMDAPESDHPQGAAATRALHRLADGQRLTVFPIEPDVYGRLVAQVQAENGADLGAAMVSQGYAVATTRFTHAYAREERQARRRARGLWRRGGIADPAAWRQAGS